VNGEVLDAHVRFQGSRYNRLNGAELTSWPAPGPTGAPVRILSWRINLPRYGRLEGRGDLILNKMSQSCPGLNAALGERVFLAAGLPAAHARYARVHVNGAYYHYMLDLERPGEEMLDRLDPDGAGHLYKATGLNGDEGPYSWADERRLEASCGYTREERYRWTYDRKTHPWGGHAALIDLVDALDAARAAGTPALRTFLADRFDLDGLLTYVAIQNWSVPFDDMFQNHFLYQRRDGKWLVLPWDLDQVYGGWLGADASLYMGEEGDPSNRSGWWNTLKDSVLEAYRVELEDRIVDLDGSILDAASVAAMVDDATTMADLDEAAAAPAGVLCDWRGRIDQVKSFAVERNTVVRSRLGGP
jgi:spore coat protein CotH